ncbi:MAG TPA: molybdenum cofactor guanylyltransferase [Ferruginibacter sp.]|jgi:molybdopterin-guanine dinucleotide biosynthesis protein A|nr:molybdenum cofactor guanylyltransferase [Ferruginibacter sp.]
MTGVVLCGGQSIRMGTDKGMLQKDATTWAQLAFNKLATLSIPVVLSVNEQQQNTYSNFFNSSSLIIDDTNFNIGGPLHGILSVHTQFPSSDLLVLACDMVAMETVVLRYLYDHALTTNKDAIVFMNAGKIEPLCGFYKTSGLQKIKILYEQGELKRHSMMNVLELLGAHYLEMSDEWVGYFGNYNLPENIK